MTDGNEADGNEERWECPDWGARLTFSLLLFGLLLSVFSDVLTNCVRRWMTEPQYSHGFFIPMMAAGLAWMRREKIVPGRARSGALGLVVIGLAIACHLIANDLYLEAMDAGSFVLAFGGLVILVWGHRFFRGVWPAVLFLAFMMPLPFQLERMLSGPLQTAGAAEATWYIQTLGIPAVAEGSTIVIGDTRLGVEEACSGLRMLMVFLAISVAAMIISKRTRWEKLLILFSAIPIALICNISRIVATAAAHHWMGRATADLIFHDLSGWLMMPMAMGLLFAELRIFDWLFVEVNESLPGIMLNRPVAGNPVK